MKLLYLWPRIDGIPQLMESSPTGVCFIELIDWQPPDIEAPYWEFHFKGGISIYTDGKTLAVVENKETKKKEDGEKVVRIRQTVEKEVPK